MRILHAPKNVAGQASMISRAQRKLGHTSDVMVFNQNRFNFECDINVGLDEYRAAFRPFIKLKHFLRVVRRYDVFHFHYGTSLLPWNLDLYYFATIGRKLGKRAIMHYWGSDVIQIDLAKKYTLIPEATLREIFPMNDDEKKRKKIERTNSLVDLSIVGDYSLLPFSPNSLVVRQAIDHHAIPFIGAGEGDGVVRVVHAPTNRDIKGTSQIIKVIDRLRSEGMPLELVLVENLPHDEAMEVYKTAEIAVDDILQGPYGIFAMECMALGKPVLGRIDPSLSHYYPGLPIISTTPETLHHELMQLVVDKQRRRDLGIKGREYIEKNHDSEMIAAQLVSLYESLLRARR
ncbi:MAG: glycosyltransferase [Methanomassiliicoccales archaeon]|nr:glycosyltransferase [Methanomassiliicoccales archaeon]